MSGTVAFAGYVDLASETVGGRALAASDDFFASKDCLVKAAAAVFDPTTYTENGKEMDGWESRRKRVPGHDWCIVALGIPGVLHGVDIDTAHFLGNHPPFASLDACTGLDANVLAGKVDWTPVLASVPLERGSRNLQPIKATSPFTHVRLNIYPDGGVARLRVYGTPAAATHDTGTQDLAALTAGGKPLACSDMFFSPMTNLLLPAPSSHMGNGWETRRSRPPGKDEIIVALGVPGIIDEVLLDTAHFKGNYPDRAVVDGLWWPGAPPQALVGHADWGAITAEAKLGADRVHTVSVTDRSPFTHVRLRIFPDGGIARMRVMGRAAERKASDLPLLAFLANAPTDKLVSAFAQCCGSRRWVAAMLTGGPYRSRTHLFGQAAAAWWHLHDTDWLEAFAHHPRIGADKDTLRKRFGATADWAAGEQAGVASADEATLDALAVGNAAYEQRFGHVFLICASGLSALEMLAALQERQDNPPWAELRHAAGEQAKITALRLEKLVETTT